MIDRVCRFSGTWGRTSVGRLVGSSPSSPTLGMCTFSARTAAVRITMAISGAGITVVSFGKNTMISRPTADEGVDQDGHADQVGHLREEDQDRQCVDESDHHAARHEPHQTGDTQQAEDDLERAAQEHRRDEVLEAVFAHQRGDDEGDGTRCRRDHRGPATDDGDGRRHGEGGEQSDSGIDSGDDGERDRLGDQRKRDHQAGEHFGPESLGRPQCGHDRDAAIASLALT